MSCNPVQPIEFTEAMDCFWEMLIKLCMYFWGSSFWWCVVLKLDCCFYHPVSGQSMKETHTHCHNVYGKKMRKWWKIREKVPQFCYYLSYFFPVKQMHSDIKCMIHHTCHLPRECFSFSYGTQSSRKRPKGCFPDSAWYHFSERGFVWKSQTVWVIAALWRHFCQTDSVYLSRIKPCLLCSAIWCLEFIQDPH